MEDGSVLVLVLLFFFLLYFLFSGMFDGYFYPEIKFKELKVLNYSTTLSYQITGRLISAIIINDTANLTIDDGKQNFLGNPDYFKVDAKIGNKTLVSGNLITLNVELKKPLCVWYVEFVNGTKIMDYDYYAYGQKIGDANCTDITEYSIP